MRNANDGNYLHFTTEQCDSMNRKKQVKRNDDFALFGLQFILDVIVIVFLISVLPILIHGEAEE